MKIKEKKEKGKNEEKGEDEDKDGQMKINLKSTAGKRAKQARSLSCLSANT